MPSANVQFKYRLKGFPIRYKQQTLRMEIPENEYGFTLVQTLNNNIQSELKKNDDNYHSLIWHKVIQGTYIKGE
jgi:hypothetical protein